MVDICYPEGAVWTCAYTEEELVTMRADEDILAVMERSEALAWSTLSSLTAYRLSLCPVVLRPCSFRCSIPTWYTAPAGSDFSGRPNGGSFSPYILNGSWFNGCGCGSVDECSCSFLSQIRMPSPVGEIVNISIDGEFLPTTAYRVDNADRLVRQDGELWPVCQDMSVPYTDPTAFFITYYPNLAPNDMLRFAAGVLAVEYFKACNGSDCRLPLSITNISRSGISYDIPSGMFENNATGIREVDAVIRIYNPNGLRQRPRVMSPDSLRGRQQTWGI